MVLQRELPSVVSAYLFGSVVEGRTHRESDVDVAVLLDGAAYGLASERFEARLRGIGALRAALGREVDLVILNEAPPQFARRVLTDGQRVLVTDEASDRAFLQTTLSRAADLEPFLRRTRRIKLATVGR